MSLRKIVKALDKDLPKVDNYGIGIMTMELFQPFHCWQYPAKIYLFKVNKRNTRERCEIYSKLTIKIPERLHWHQRRHSGVFFVNFEHILSPFSSVSVVNFEQVNIIRVTFYEILWSIMKSFVDWWQWVRIIWDIENRL